MCARLQVHLPSQEKKLRFETQLTLDGARSQSIINSFSEARKQPGVVPLNWKGAWQISGTGEIPVDHPENFRCHGDMALDGDLVYASGQDKHRPAEASFFRARGGAGGVDLGPQGGPLGGEVSMFRGCRSLWPRRRRNCESKRSSHSTAPGCNRSSTVLARTRKQPAAMPVDWKGAWRISGTAEIPMDHPEHFRWNGDARARWRLRLCKRPDKHRPAETDFFRPRGGAGGDHFRFQGGPLGGKPQMRRR